MKRLATTLVTLLTVLCGMAQGWPANYGGVMLQGFYWDSYDDTRWSTLTSQADELSQYFDLIWVPNSGQTKEDQWNSAGNWGYQNMGYMPVYWLRHNTCFGSEEELKTMISTFKAKGTGIIEDVVINHKNGLTGWADFPNESVTTTNGTYNITWATDMTRLWGICANDELYTSEGGLHGGTQYSSDGSARNDEGDNFDGCRDLDHTNATVQDNIKAYLSFLKQELGYVGYRYDMVKGYAGYYVGMYNNYAQAAPEFSVGEYWDASYSNVVGWINDTKLYGNASAPRSAAFDFPLKYKLNEAFNNGNWGVLSDKGIAGSPEMSRYAVTFVDNHDTYRNDYDRVNNNVLAANAFILALPGTPCIFLPHWQNKLYKPSLKKMIAARTAAGITNQSTISAQYALDGGYYMKVTGTKGSVIVLCGQPNNSDLSQHQLVCSGDNFAFYLWEGVYDASTYEAIDAEEANDINIFVKDNGEGTPYLYLWNGDTKYNGEWPGAQLTQTVTLADGTTWYKQTVHAASVNAIVTFNDGHQSSNIEGITGDEYICYWKGNDGKYADYTSFYESYDGSSHYDVYFDSPWGADTRIWAWAKNYYGGEKNYTGTWPGQSMTKVGTSSTGNDIYRWRMTVSASDGVPDMVLFTNNGSDGERSAEMELHNNAYYTTSGMGNADLMAFQPAAVLENATAVSATNYNGSSETVAQLTKASGKDAMSMTVCYPAATYTVQAIVRGTAGKSVNLSVGTATATTALTGMEASAPSAVATNGTVDNAVPGTNGGWQKVQATYELTEAEALKIRLTSDADTWQVGALTIVKNADAAGQYQTIATTSVSQTFVDVTENQNFSFFDRGVNKNALVKAGASQTAAHFACNTIIDGTCQSLLLADFFNDTATTETFTATAASYDRTFVPGTKSTVCLPFSLTAEEAQAAGSFYQLDSYDAATGTVHFAEVTEPQAYTAYLFMPATAQPFLSLGQKSISTTSLVPTEKDGLTFQGVMDRTHLVSTEGSTTYYGYSTSGEFVRVGTTQGAYLNPFRASLVTTAPLPARLKTVFGGDPSGISELTTADDAVQPQSAVICNLQGQRVAAPRHGLYIVGGKKCYVK